MIKNQQIREDLILLFENEKWPELKVWFSYWSSEEEMIDKVLLWGRTFMTQYFPDPSPEFHRELIRAFFSKKNEFIAAPRGMSKTTLIQLCIAFSIANKLDPYIVLLEKNFTEASEVLDAVRTEFADNNKIKQVYGKLMVKRVGSEEKDKDAQGDMLINGVRLRGKGYDSPIRGMKYRHSRPSKIIGDDVEDDTHINQPEQRKKYLDKYNKAIVPAVSIDGSIKMYGTILHMDSLLNNLITWHQGKVYKAYNVSDPEHTLLWPERWNWQRLMQKKADMISAGKSTNAFAQEYLNDPLSDEDRKFKYLWLYNPLRQFNLKEMAGKNYNTYCAIDPADSKKDGSDYTGCVVVAIDDYNNWYLLDVRRERLNITAKLDLVFQIWDKWRGYNLRSIGFAKNALEDEIRPLFREECEKRHSYPILSQLKEMGRNKESRIAGALVGRYEQGKIWDRNDTNNERYDIEELKQELYNFPSSSHDDLSDSLSLIDDMIIANVQRGFRVSEMKVPDFSEAAKSIVGA
jgi:hypothetical protein